MKANFRAPSYTVGVEEELMIVDSESFGLANEVETLIGDFRGEGEVKRELMESVLEVATEPCANTREVALQLRDLRREVSDTAQRHGLCIGSAGTHPFAMWEDQRISQQDRYRDLVSALRFVARQEIIFGLHVHVGIDDREKAIHVANGMRVHVPILLALSANSPFWRAAETGLASSRMPVFRAFPRVGIPPYYHGWDDYERRIEFMVASKVIKDYTYLWFDVRPHPTLGTVEIRAMDAQTRLEHTLAITALVQAMVKELAEHFEAGRELSSYPYEMLDENKWLAARHGLDGELIDLPRSDLVLASDLARRLYDRLRPHAEELGSLAQFDGLLDIIEHGNGATRQRLVYEANHDFTELVRDIVGATAPP